MTDKIRKSAADLVAEANRTIRTLTPAEAEQLSRSGEAVLVDIRDIRELQREGRIAGARHCPRGMLEFWVDPASVYHKPFFAEDKTFVFFCAGGMRSALATRTVQDMGLDRVAHIGGGFAAWKQAGLPVEAPEPKDEQGRT